MWEYAWRQCQSEWRLEEEIPLPDEVIQAIEWISARTADEVQSEREDIIIERVGNNMKENGLCEEWLEKLEPGVRSVVSE
eukprot:10637542-Karenia_brevis.AAC.1